MLHTLLLNLDGTGPWSESNIKHLLEKKHIEPEVFKQAVCDGLIRECGETEYGETLYEISNAGKNVLKNWNIRGQN